MNRKLKICHIITRMIVGGAQENTLLTIVGHLKKGHEVTLITGPSPGPEGKLLKNHDVPDFEIVEDKNLVRELDPVRDIAAYFSLKKFLKERKFDVVHTHSSKAGIIGRAAAYSAGTKVVVHTIHGQAFHKYEKPWKNFIYKFAERWAAKRCHKIFAVARAMIDQCLEAKIAPEEKYKVVYSGMKLEPFLKSSPDIELRKKLCIPPDAKVVGTVARLFPLKGYEDFIPVAAGVSKMFPETRYLIIGDGIMMDTLKKEAGKLKLEDKFIFAGLVPPDDIYRYISLMDVLVHLSMREGLPRAVVQALASGKPAVAYSLDGTPEVVINGQTGYLISPGDVDAVVGAVTEILKLPEKAAGLGSNGRTLVSEKFDWKHMADVLESEYLKLYDEKIAGKNQ